jgi:hypothetical protein
VIHRSNHQPKEPRAIESDRNEYMLLLDEILGPVECRRAVCVIVSFERHFEKRPHLGHLECRRIHDPYCPYPSFTHATLYA